MSVDSRWCHAAFREHLGLSIPLLADFHPKGEMAAGTHSVTWTLDKKTPSGVYFYKVVAGNNLSTGKITRID